jgi:hypothetical protein
MGGFGSGHFRPHIATVESCLCLDLRRLVWPALTLEDVDRTEARELGAGRRKMERRREERAKA